MLWTLTASKPLHFATVVTLYFQQQYEGTAGSSYWDCNSRKGSGLWTTSSLQEPLQPSGHRSLTTPWNSSSALGTQTFVFSSSQDSNSIAFLPILRYHALEHSSCYVICHLRGVAAFHCFKQLSVAGSPRTTNYKDQK